MNVFRNLSDAETAILKKNGCTSGEWGRITVSEGFEPSSCRNVIFSGDVRLGAFRKPYSARSGVIYPAGIVNALIHNCSVGSDSVIFNIGECISNYNIGDNVAILNCGTISTEGSSSFGNATAVSVINEAGGRSVKIWDRMSSHEAYISALYRHRPGAVEAIERMADDYAEAKKSDRGSIGNGSVISGCAKIRNVAVGPSAVIEGAAMLNDGSVNSTDSDPVFIGSGVIMEHFIVCSGSVVSESAIIDKCFIGQGCTLSKQFSAENSLFFANCVGYHGEACSVFAGPFTISHHKSTLLIAGLFSFMNAGSGTNQSNHMYKLGPVHQGIMERGSKTSSNSYMLWPARIGLFTLVLGRHYSNPDSASLPFSYLLESNGESLLIPAVNLKSVGTIRDARKWPKRDRRKDSRLIDQISFELLNPYTAGKMAMGRSLLHELRTGNKGAVEYIRYNNMIIKLSSADRGIELYQAAVDKYLGDLLVRRLGDMEFSTNEELREILRPGGPTGRGEWIDMAGLLAPGSEVDRLLTELEEGRFSSSAELSQAFEVMNSSYREWEWSWCCGMIEEETGVKIEDLSAGDVIEIVKKWKKSVEELDNLIYEDAGKEFNSVSMTGYGIDGDESARKEDFKAVRGAYETNIEVASIKEHASRKIRLGDELIARLKNVK